MSNTYEKYMEMSAEEKLQLLGVVKLKVLCNNHKIKTDRSSGRGEMVDKLKDLITDSDFPVVATTKEDKLILKQHTEFSQKWKNSKPLERLSMFGIKKLVKTCEDNKIDTKGVEKKSFKDYPYFTDALKMVSSDKELEHELTKLIREELIDLIVKNNIRL